MWATLAPPEMNRPASIGQPLALTDCRILDLNDREVAPGEPGELVMRGPQFMLGYWKEPQATAAVLRDGWYYSGDIVRTDADGFYYVLDRRKEMIKYKGFPVAPAEVESVLLEHPAVRDCGVVAKPDVDAGEIPCAFVVLREGFTASTRSTASCALSSPTAWPITNNRVKFTLSTPCLARHRARCCGGNCARALVDPFAAR